MANPLCPRDSTPLTPTKDVFGPGTSAHVCRMCNGVLADWDTASKFFTSVGLTLTDLQTLVKFAADKARKSDPVPCTSCGKGMMNGLVHKGIELDLCEACGSAWFDRGELQRISKGELGKAVSSQAPQSGKVVGVFEMWWDCGHCDTKGLLGASNRFCPNCGAQQDAASRYFPPAGQESAANHDFDGADVACPACNTPNGAKAHNCRNCGSPLDGSAPVATVADRSSAPKQPVAAAKKPWPWKWIIGAAVALLLGCCGITMFWTKEIPLTVAGHSWERTIDVETMTATRDSDWCDSMPSDAYGVSRSRKQRSTNKIPDGETCTTRDVDRGNGTFERRQECKTKYREEPVYDQHCSYTVDRWKVTRTAKAGAAGLDCSWPAVGALRGGAGLGAEREGSRGEKYSLQLKGEDGKAYTCTLPEAKWRAVTDGFKKVIPVGVITSSPECDKL